MANCRFCCEDIDDRARRCPHCHADISFFGRFKPIVTALAAVGGLAFGFYEQHVAKNSQAELEREHEALVKLIDSVPEQNIPDEFKTAGSEAECAAALKRDPKNAKARLRLRVIESRARQQGKAKPRVAARPPVRTALNQRNGSPRRRNNAAKSRR